MKIEIPPGKIVAIVGMAFIFGIGIISINLTDNQKVTRHELTRFYESEMDSCKIENIDTLDVANRGGYQVFYTDCSSDFYPIFLEDNSKNEVIKVNSLIIKNSNSLDIRILENDKHYDIKIRHPDSQDDRWFGTKIMLGFISVVTILILLTPNSKFKKIEDM